MTLKYEERDGIQIVSGSSHPELAHDTAIAVAGVFEGNHLDTMELKTFPSSEQYIRYEASVRKKHVFIMQTMVASDGQSVDNALVQAALMADAAKRGSASEVTLVAPLMAYARQDRKTKGRDPISGAWAIDMLVGSGVDRFVTIDMHSSQMQGVTKKPFDHLTAEGLIRDELALAIATNPERYIIVSPDSGRAKASENYGANLGVGVVHLPKLRDHDDSSKIRRPHLSETIDGQICILIDDMIDTAGTLVSAVDTLREAGAAGIIAAATHGVFSEPAMERLATADLDRIIVTDTVPQKRARTALGERLTVLSVAPLLGQAVVEITRGGSISDMFEGKNYS
jgi:ribose-phosphate pyrophosphokinase